MEPLRQGQTIKVEHVCSPLGKLAVLETALHEWVRPNPKWLIPKHTQKCAGRVESPETSAPYRQFPAHELLIFQKFMCEAAAGNAEPLTPRYWNSTKNIGRVPRPTHKPFFFLTQNVLLLTVQFYFTKLTVLFLWENILNHLKKTGCLFMLLWLESS